MGNEYTNASTHGSFLKQNDMLCHPLTYPRPEEHDVELQVCRERQKSRRDDGVEHHEPRPRFLYLKEIIQRNVFTAQLVVRCSLILWRMPGLCR